jgi:hypothetical protein
MLAMRAILIEMALPVRLDAAGFWVSEKVGEKVMTGKNKQPNDPQADPPKQDGGGSQSEAESFANIEPDDGDTSANIDPEPIP